ncbi:hypothetical protein H0Z60_02790 [Ectothiorhodospiraceae bacterium WFHF3C12]|nr:hypothetical protein [Ectothiorhodospiraceae bacterium WFHF3C12]
MPLRRTFALLLLTWATAQAGAPDGRRATALDENWRKFGHHQRFELTREALREHWPVLHQRDAEPFPDAERIRALAADLGRAPPDDALATARAMQDAWRAYHAGRLHDAYRLARAQGPYGYYLAERAWVAYTGTLAPEDMRLPLLEAAVRRVKANPQPRSRVRLNAYWVQGLLLGQYSRHVSTAVARERNIPDRVSRVLEWVLEHRPDHAQAWINLGAYHSEIIERVGWLLARMTYGASAEHALDAYERGLALAPGMAVGYGEAAMGLHRIDAEAHRARIREYVARLRGLQPKDAEDFLEKRRSLKRLEAAGY